MQCIFNDFDRLFTNIFISKVNFCFSCISNEISVKKAPDADKISLVIAYEYFY